MAAVQEVKAVEEVKVASVEEIPVTGPNVRAAVKQPMEQYRVVLNRTGGLDLLHGPNKDIVWYSFKLTVKAAGQKSRSKTVQELAAEIDGFIVDRQKEYEAVKASEQLRERRAAELDSEQLMAAIGLFQRHPKAMTLAPDGKSVRLKRGEFEIAIYQLHGKPGRWDVDVVHREGAFGKEPGLDEAAVAELVKRLA